MPPPASSPRRGSRATHSAAPGSGFNPSLRASQPVPDLLGVANPLGSARRSRQGPSHPAQDEVVLLAERGRGTAAYVRDHALGHGRVARQLRQWYSSESTSVPSRSHSTAPIIVVRSLRRARACGNSACRPDARPGAARPARSGARHLHAREELQHLRPLDRLDGSAAHTNGPWLATRTAVTSSGDTPAGAKRLDDHRARYSARSPLALRRTASAV